MMTTRSPAASPASHALRGAAAGARRNRIGRALLLFWTVGALGTLGGCERFTSADTWVARGEAAMAQGRYTEVKADIDNALDKKPNSKKALLLDARLYLKRGMPRYAQERLNRALHAGVPHSSVVDLQSRILLATGKFAEAETLLASDRGLASAQRADLLAQAHLGQHHFDAAAAVLSSALQANPGNVALLTTRARLLAAQNQSDGALQALDEALKADPHSALAWLLRGEILLRRGAIADAIAAFGHARDTARLQLDFPQDAALLQELAGAQLDLGHAADAKATVAELDQHFPNTIGTKFLDARMAVVRQDYATAIDDLQPVLSAAPNFLPARLLDAAALFHSGQPETAESQLNGLLGKDPQNLPARRLLAQVELGLHKPDAARRALQGAPGAADDAQSNWLLGTALMETGEKSAGLDYLQRSVAEDPRQDGTRERLARMYIASGQGAKAVALLEGIPPAKRDIRTDSLLLVAVVSGRTPAAAKQAVADLLAAHPDDGTLHAAAGSLFASVGDFPSAQREFDRSLQRDPHDLAAMMGMAQLRVRQSQYDAAKTQLQAVLQENPKYQPAYRLLAAIAVHQGDRKEAETVLAQAISADPSAVRARLMLADLALAGGDARKAQALIEQAGKVSSNPGATLDAGGQILLRGGLVDAALSIFNKAASAGSPAARLDAARALIALGRNDEARSALAAVADTTPGEKLPATLLLVDLDLREHDADAARHRIARLGDSGLLPAYAIDALQANLDMRLKQYPAAARKFSAAFATQPTAALAIKTFQARSAAGQANPQHILTQWLAAHPGDGAVSVALAQYDAGNGQQADAIRIYEQLVRDPGRPNLVVLNNLAWLYAEAGDPRAVATAQRALALAPQSAQVMDTDGWVLFRSGKTQDGIAMLEKARQSDTKDPAIAFHLASALAQAGDKNRAAGLLQDLLKGSAQFPERAQAESLLHRLQ